VERVKERRKQQPKRGKEAVECRIGLMTTERRAKTTRSTDEKEEVARKGLLDDIGRAGDYICDGRVEGRGRRRNDRRNRWEEEDGRGGLGLGLLDLLRKLGDGFEEV
jgi:hypothetical protein